MLRSLGENLTSQDFIKIALGKQHAFVILQNGDIQRPLVVPYPILLQAIASSIDLPAGSAAWGSIGAGTGVGSQADLVAYLVANYYPLLSNPANYITASVLATALAGYVPTSRTLTINGVTFDLSADRSWTVSGGSAAWGSIGAGTGVGSQADLVAYLVANYYPLVGNPSGFITSAALSPYLLITTAASTYFPIPTGSTSQYLRGDGSLGSLPFELIAAASDETTALTTGTAKVTFRMPRAVTLTAVRASLTTAQASGSLFTVDINENGSSILSTKITIDNTEKTSTTAVTQPVISDTSLADDAEITVDIDQIGNGTATGLKIYLIGTY